MAATPVPRSKYPVRTAIFVKGSSKCSDRVKVLAARIEPKQVAKIEMKERMKRMTSRFHKGQFWSTIWSACIYIKGGLVPRVDRWDHLRAEELR
jgi:hypothetical protein